MADKKKVGWDMTSRDSFEAGANWLRKQSGAFVVVAIRADGGVVSLHDNMAPMDAIQLLQKAFPRLLAAMESLDLERRRL